MTKVYIDGQSGTTGLQIHSRIEARKDLELLRIPEEKRHDIDARKEYLNSADLVFLCLPDDAARESVSLIENPDVRVIDASTAHRTADGWIYGFPELSKENRMAIAAGKRVANPGCHATGLISSVAPLVRMGILPKEYPLTCSSLTGYSGGGKKMIAAYESAESAQATDAALSAPGLYGLNLHHKHLPEMQKVTGLSYPPVFLPIVDDYAKGMATSIFLHNALLQGNPSAQEIRERLAEYYAEQKLVKVREYVEQPSTIYANGLAGTDRLELIVCGHKDQTIITALFDNLGKGASGAAVQNMNIMLGIAEDTGLQA